MSDDLTTLRAAAEGRAPLPWHIEDADIRDANDGTVACGVDVPESALAYLVAAANAAPGLVAEVERLRVKVSEMRSETATARAEAERLRLIAPPGSVVLPREVYDERLATHAAELREALAHGEAGEREAVVAWLRGNGHDLPADEIAAGAHRKGEP